MASRTFLGRYETVRLLGEGGMGRVYLAKQTDLGRQVVVKVMHEHIANDPKFCERFRREMLLHARFQHPFVVSLIDASLDDPQGPCIIMEYVRGISLDTLFQRNGRLTPARAGCMLAQLCEALHAAHSVGIIHRDLKPANLMVVDPDTPYEKLKVMDFGLAKLIDNSSGMAMVHRQSNTGLDFAVGTPGYISPEQVRGEDTDYRCDIYSVGVILYELLTGRLPFIRDETMDVLFAHATEAPPSFKEVGAADWAPSEIETVVMAALAKRPNDRPGSARELASLYQKALQQIEYRRDSDPEILDPTVADNMNEPSTVVLPPPMPLPAFDANIIVHQINAWMPDAIATFKLRGFVQDNNGEVLESVPGKIKMRIGANTKSGAFSWLGIGHKNQVIDLELRLERTNPQQTNQLHITVLMSSPHRKAAEGQWRERCSEVFCELRSYLAGVVVAS